MMAAFACSVKVSVLSVVGVGGGGVVVDESMFGGGGVELGGCAQVSEWDLDNLKH
jgi:hypothetical protein